jgi:uncharacterized protein (TIGR00730 family)
MKKAEKAFKNQEYLNSSAARTLRILAEYQEPEKRFKENGIRNTVVFFGSARTPSPEAGVKGGTTQHYIAAEEFAYQLGRFSHELQEQKKDFAICTGGGPGIMEAANRGARRAEVKSIGLNISLPFEQHPNDYIDPELNFEFHYFFMRKLWFLYHAKAFVCFPGGFGTIDELFETLTLIQTEKYEKNNVPILLYDEEYWKSLINFDKLVSLGMISQEDLDLFLFFSSIEEGLELLKPRLIESIQKYAPKISS